MECEFLPEDLSGSSCVPGVSLDKRFVRGGDELKFSVSLNQLNFFGYPCSETVNSLLCSHAIAADLEEGGTPIGPTGGYFFPYPQFQPYRPHPVEYNRFQWSFPGAKPLSYNVTFTIADDAGYCFDPAAPTTGCFAGLHNGDIAQGYCVMLPFNIGKKPCGEDARYHQQCKKNCPPVDGSATTDDGDARVNVPAPGGLSWFSTGTTENGMKNGWSFLGGLQAELTEDPDPEIDDIEVKYGHGPFDGWLNASYDPAHCDNYKKAEKNGDFYTITDKDLNKMVFDSNNGLVTTMSDRNGNTTTITRDGNDRITQVSDGKGRNLYFDYGSRTDSQPVGIRENNPTTGRLTSFAYDGSDRLTSVTLPEGDSWSFTYSGNKLATVTDPRGKLAYQFTWSGDKVATETIYSELKHTFSRSTVNEQDILEIEVEDLTGKSTPAVRTHERTLDKHGMLVKVVDALDNTFLYEFHDFESPYLMTRAIDPNLNETRYTWDDKGNVTSITDAQGNTTTLVYAQEIDDPLNAKHEHLVREIHRPKVTVNGSLVTYDPTILSYDANGNLIEIEDATGESTTFSVASDGEINSITDRNGNTTSFTYTSPRRNLLTVTTPAGPSPAPSRTITFAYDDYDNVTSVTDPLSNVWSFDFDDQDRPTKITDARSKYVDLSYLDGILEYLEAPANNGSSSNRRRTDYTYDDSSRLTRIDSDISASSQEMRVRFEFDGFSNLRKLVRLMDSSEKSTSYDFDILNRHKETKDPLNRSTSVEHEPYCIGFKETTARGILREYGFDNLCRLTEVKVADELHAYEYDELGRLVKVTQTENIPSRYGQARFGKARFSSGAATVEERTFLYDSLDRLTKVTFPGNETILYEYGKEGELTKMTDTNGKVTNYQYYNDLRLHKVIIERPSQSDRVFEYFYDAAGRLEKIVYPTETGSTAPIEARFYGTAGASTEPGWDENGNLLRLFYHRDGARIQSFEYAYDDSGNRVSLVDTPANTANKVTWAYTYDWLGRLAEVKRGVGVATPVTVSLYAYDESDNRIQLDLPQLGAGETHTYTYDLADQIVNRSVKVGAGATNVVETFQHDEDGNMTSRTLVAGSQTTSYTWSRHDKLVKIELPNSDTLTNAYDSGGVRKTRTGDDGVKLKSFYSGLPTASEEDTASNSFSWFLGHMLMGFEKNGARFYYLTDGLGSVRVMVDSDGDEAAAYEFDEFGQRIATSETGGSSSKTYVGGLGAMLMN